MPPESEANSGMIRAGSSAQPRFINVPTTLAVVVVVVTSAVSGVLGGPHQARVVVVLAIGLMLAGSTFGVAWCERFGTPTATAVVLVGLTILGGFIMAVSHLAAFLIVMPIISLAVLFGSSRWGVLVTALYTALVAVMGVRLGQPWFGTLQACAGFVAAGAFVVVFSQLMRSERFARARVESLASELEQANARLRHYAAQVEDLATAKERNRLAREIHDSLGHFLTVVHVQIEAAKKQLDLDPKRAVECLARAQKLTQEGLAEVRRSVAVLRAPPTEARPLPEAIAYLVNECRATGMDADLLVTGSPRPLAPPIEFALYRAVQEALTNVRRHACAKRADLELAYGEKAVELRVKDDGVGAASTGGGFGLLGLHERVHLVGGTVTVRTERGRGFALEVCVPT
jgi:signal transduction histidine kinase